MGGIVREVRKIFYFSFFLLLFKIYENQTVGFVGVEGKVDPRNEGYAWAPKS